MYVVVFVMPGQEGVEPSKEQLANLRELVAGFGAMMAQQLHGRDDGNEAEDAGDGEGFEPIGDQVIVDEGLVSYLEDCYRLQ